MVGVDDAGPQIADLQGLTESDLAALYKALFAEGREVIESRDGFDLEVLNGELPEAVVLKRAAEGRPALDRIPFARLSRTAFERNLRRLSVLTTGVLNAENRPHLDDAMSKLERVAKVSIRIIDAEELLRLLHDAPVVEQRFFPQLSQTSEVAKANGLSPRLLEAATALAANAPEAGRPSGPSRYSRLAFCVVVLTTVVAVPVRLDSCAAVWVGSIGLITILAAISGVALARNEFGVPFDRRGGLLAGSLFPSPDDTAVLRRITFESWGTPGVVGLIAVLALIRVLRSTWSGVLAFVCFFAFAYLLLWGLSPEECKVIASCHGAFAGAGTNPSVGDFVYVSTQAAFFNQAGALSGASHLTHAALTAEFLLAAVLLVDLAASIGLRNGSRSRPE